MPYNRPASRDEVAALRTVGQVQLSMLSDREHRFLAQQRVAHLATADRGAIPHVVPVCFGLCGETLYIAIDQKPKRRPAADLKRLRNISENAAVAIVIDRYDEDWGRLGWVMLHGRAEILTSGKEHARAQALLRSRYSQLEKMALSGLPVIAVRIQRATSWGDLSSDETGT